MAVRQYKIKLSWVSDRHGVVSQNVVLPTSESIEPVAIDQLYREALNYVDRWNQSERELADLLQITLVRPIPTLVTMGGVVECVLFSENRRNDWKVVLDAD